MSAVTDESHYDSISQTQIDRQGKVLPLDLKSRDKGKRYALNPSLTPSRTNSPDLQKDTQSESRYLSLPPSSDSSEVTPTAASLKPPLRPPARSPFRQSQQPSPRPRGVSNHPLPPTESPPMPANDDPVPIPRQGRADSDAARARRREAYKSGMSFVSLYELYTDPPPLPIPPVPPLESTNFTSTTGSWGRSRSQSGSARAGRERKNSLHESTSALNVSTIDGDVRARSGSTGASSMRSPNQVPKPHREPLATEQLNSLGLANATIYSAVPNSPDEATPTKSKRQHVLFEILETERIYSSDMALIKAVHLPMALGLKVDFGPMGSGSASMRSNTDPTVEVNDPSRSSGTSTNTASSSQSQSGSSGHPVTNEFILRAEPPMSVEDAKVIFANIDELAEFTGRFTEFIQLALGSEIDGGVGPDKIGALFLEMLPIMSPIYETYITKHSASTARLTAITTENPTPAMLSYIEKTKAIASTHSNSWDLGSLLIKPIQRFLKYPLLLETLLISTPDTHPDRPSLNRAKAAMVEASRLVNEQTQKVEICRTILQRKPLKGLSAVFSASAPNSQQLKVKGSKSVFAVAKAKDVPSHPSTPSPSVTPFDAAFDPIQLENRLVEHASGGAGGLEKLVHHLQGFETTIPRYVQDIVTWVRSVRETLVRLEKWANAFERVITLDDTGGIEALDAFKAVLTDRLSPILSGLETAVRVVLVPALEKIQGSMRGPTLLLNTAASLRTVHNQLMNTPYTSKTSRPSPQVVEGSKTYLALMQQLKTDLPVYVRHLDRMFGFVVLEVAKWQERWYREVGQGWSDLWAALDVGPGSRKEYRARRHKELSAKKRAPRNPHPEDNAESELQQRGAYGCNGEETAAIWWDRWEGVNLAIKALGVPSGAALQGVKSLQGLIKHPPAPVAGVHYPLEAPSPPRNAPFSRQPIHEGTEDEEEDVFSPPGYYPVSPSSADRRVSRYAPSRDSTSTQEISSPTQLHPLNSLLPAVSPGAGRKERSPKNKTVTFPASLGSSSMSPGEVHDHPAPGRVNKHEGGPTNGHRNRARSEEHLPNRDERPSAVRSTSHAEASTSTSSSKVHPKSTSSFRKRLSDATWFGDGSKKPDKAGKTGLELDPEEPEAALATTHAREEREADLISIGQRSSFISGEDALGRRPSHASLAELHRPRKVSTNKGSGSSGTRPRRIGSVSSRPRASVDGPRNVVSEYGRALVPTLDATGPSLFGDDAPIMFTCTAVAVFTPKDFRYAGLPFLALEIGDLVNIIKDAGRPAQHPALEPAVSDGVDTLFIGRKLPDDPGAEAEVGWLWASFVMPLEG